MTEHLTEQDGVPRESIIGLYVGIKFGLNCLFLFWDVLSEPFWVMFTCAPRHWVVRSRVCHSHNTKTHTLLWPQVCERIGDVSAEVTPPAVTVLAGESWRENESVNECNGVDFRGEHRRPFSSDAFNRNATNGHCPQVLQKWINKM